MIDIYLVRHGEAAAAWGEDPDPGLSHLGRQQARQVRDELERYRDLHIVSSPLLRAQETAQPLATALRKQVHVDETFREIPSPVGIDDRQAWLSGFMRQDWQDQGPEILGWRESAWNALFEINRHTAIFTHFMVINAICARLTEAPETVCCVPDNGSITRLRLDDHSLQLVEVGRQRETRVA
jgi:broad specificity phosphatase PhoE